MKTTDIEGIKDFSLTNYLLCDEACSRGIKAKVLLSKRIIELEYKGKYEYINVYILSRSSKMTVMACENKHLTKSFLNKMKLKTTAGKTFSIVDQKSALEYSRSHFPVVIKPNSSVKGRGIYTNIANKDDLARAWKKIEKNDHQKVIIEEQFEGNEYRLFATKHKFIAAAMRDSANVVGDGINNIEKLVELKNKFYRQSRSNQYRKINNIPLVKGRIIIDDVVKFYLKKNGLNVRYVPEINEKIYIRKNSNISTGGDSIDVTDTVHESVKKIAVDAICSIPGLLYGGVDMMTKDITNDHSGEDYRILEINHNPAFGIHHFVHFGQTRNVAKEIIDLIFPETKRRNNEN